MFFAPIAPSPESLGIPSAALEKFVRQYDRVDTPHALILLRHGQTALSMSWAPFDTERKHILHSLSKSFTSIAIGIAYGEGLLDLDAPFLKYLHEYDGFVTDEKMRRVTLRHLLSMNTGHDPEPSGLVQQPEGAQEWCQAFAASKLAYEPGSHFSYNSLGTHMLAAVVRKTTGLNVREYLMPRFFEPLGILPGQWELSPGGTDAGGWGFMLSTTDLAKVGQCLLQHGRWQEKQLIPQAYLEEACRVQSDNSANDQPDWKVGYGFQFWMSRHGYRGDGAFGQYIAVVPEDDMVLATNACLANMQQVLDFLWELRENFSDQPLPENPAALASLRAFCTGRIIRPFDRIASNPPPAPVHGIVYSDGLTEMTVDANAVECAITFQRPGRYEQLRASFLEPLGSEFTLMLDDVSPHPYRAIADWESPTTLRITAVALDMGWVDTYRIAIGTKKDTLERTSTFALELGWCHRPRPIEAKRIN